MSLISIVVPAYDSAPGLRALLGSLRASAYRDFEVVVNDDVRSTDDTPLICERFRAYGMRVCYLRENHSMAQGRLRGAAQARGSVLLHLDTDMTVTPGLLGELAALLDAGFDALVIPERSVGSTFWARCKALEKRCYDGVEQIESLRCLRRDVYDAVGGHDPAMVFSEDKDLDLRVRGAGFRVGRSRAHLLHHEGELRLTTTVRKKLRYAGTADVFAARHPEAFRRQADLLFRFRLYLRHWRYLRTDPLPYAGMWLMKTAEFAAGAVGRVRARLTAARPAGTGGRPTGRAARA